MALSPAQIVAALRKWNVNYRLYPGWETRGRPGTWNGNKGFVWHHTGGTSQSDSYLKFLFIDGRASEGIPGPLCQFAIRDDGVVFVGAAGRANHAGRGSSSTLSKVRNENYSGYSSEIRPGPDDIDGNAEYLGVEIMYAGTRAMTAAQYRSAIRLAAAITSALGGTALSAIGHREHSGRKWDPGSHKLYTMRQDTRAYLQGGSTPPPPPPPPPPEEDDMPYKDWPLADRQALVADTAKAVNETKVRLISPGVRAWAEAKGWNPDQIPLGYQLNLALEASVEARNIVKNLRNVVPAELAAALAPLLGDSASQATVEAALRNVLPELVFRSDLTPDPQ